jgi:hypothetical protein
MSEGITGSVEQTCTLMSWSHVGDAGTRRQQAESVAELIEPECLIHGLGSKCVHPKRFLPAHITACLSTH